jgi:hypothetical protein
MKKESIKYVVKISHKKLRKSTHWITASGDSIVIKDIEFNHLVNIIKYLLKSKEDSIEYDLPLIKLESFGLDSWVNILRNELKFRK